MNGSGRINWTGWLVFGLFLLLWEGGSRFSPKLQLYIPPVSQVIVALSHLIVSGQVTTHLFATLRRFSEGYLLAAAIAVTLGIVLGYFRFAHSLLEMLIEFLRPMRRESLPASEGKGRGPGAADGVVFTGHKRLMRGVSECWSTGVLGSRRVRAHRSTIPLLQLFQFSLLFA